MIVASTVEPKVESEIRIIQEHWPLAADGTPLLLTESEQPEPFLTDEEWQKWQQIRAEDKAWELANWEKYCQEIENLFK